MHTTTHSSETVGQLVLVDVDPIRQRVKQAIAGFLAGYSGTTLEAYRLDLRQWIGWLDSAGVDPFDVARAHIELYARWCESEGKARERSVGACRRSAGSTDTALRNGSLTATPQHTFADRNRTTSRQRLASIAMSSGRSWSRQGFLVAAIMPSRVCWR